MARDWQLMFISVPIIFLLEMLFATWSWAAAQPDAAATTPGLSPGSSFLFYQQPPDLYLGGCEFLSPDHHATGESAALLSDDRPPFPEKHGLLDAQDYQRRLVELGRRKPSPLSPPENCALSRSGGWLTFC
jgi:hypothetical protein